MTPKEKRELKERLLQQRTELTKEVESLHKVDAETKIDCGAEAAERAALEEERSFVHRHEQDNTNLIKKINLALERLENGTYETCLGCGGPIPLERLFAKPSVALCMVCQKAKDES